MKRIVGALLVSASLLLAQSGSAVSAEHGGTPMRGEHPGREISARTVKNAIKEHVKEAARANNGVLLIHDDKLNKDWRLQLDKIHDPVRTFEKDGKTIYFACSDFLSVDSDDRLDIDFWMVEKGGKLEVIDTRIHKLNGEPRFTYEGTTIKELR